MGPWTLNPKGPRTQILGLLPKYFRISGMKDLKPENGDSLDPGVS